MKIALLNLRFDNNYGGNLQRYALMKVVKDMGHEIIHLNWRFNPQNPDFIHKTIIILKHLRNIICGRHRAPLKSQLFPKDVYLHECKLVDLFYDKYINHTNPIYTLEDLVKYKNFDCFIVGSDQVWRKKIAAEYIETMFFNYLDPECKKIGFSISLGNDTIEYTQEESYKLKQLYSRFFAVSVREHDAITLFKYYGWSSPQAVHTLDPTFLLPPEDYQALIDQSNTFGIENKYIFCYILDMNDEIKKIIKREAKRLNLSPVIVSLKNSISIEQWLRDIKESEFVITDSYHGFVFSIIFNKPFLLIKNKFRGTSRFDSLCISLDVNLSKEEQDWMVVNRHIREKREFALNFLKTNLSIQHQ